MPRCFRTFPGNSRKFSNISGKFQKFSDISRKFQNDFEHFPGEFKGVGNTAQRQYYVFCFVMYSSFIKKQSSNKYPSLYKFPNWKWKPVVTTRKCAHLGAYLQVVPTGSPEDVPSSPPTLIAIDKPMPLTLVLTTRIDSDGAWCSFGVINILDTLLNLVSGYLDTPPPKTRRVICDSFVFILDTFFWWVSEILRRGDLRHITAAPLKSLKYKKREISVTKLTALKESKKLIW